MVDFAIKSPVQLLAPVFNSPLDSGHESPGKEKERPVMVCDIDGFVMIKPGYTTFYN